MMSKPKAAGEMEKNLVCGICSNEYPESKESSRCHQRGTSELRCPTCAGTCSACGRTGLTCRMFSKGTNQCKLCSHGLHRCSVCAKDLYPVAYSPFVLKSWKKGEIRFLVCGSCRALGYEYNNIEEIRCREDHICGRGAFESHAFRSKIPPLCRACQTQSLCKVCLKRKDPDEFPPRRIAKAKSCHRSLICKVCTLEDISPRDITTYWCCGNGVREPHACGHLKFTHADLTRQKKYSDRSTIVFRCVDCKGEAGATRITWKERSTRKAYKVDRCDKHPSEAAEQISLEMYLYNF